MRMKTWRWNLKMKHKNLLKCPWQAWKWPWNMELKIKTTWRRDQSPRLPFSSIALYGSSHIRLKYYSFILPVEYPILFYKRTSHCGHLAHFSVPYDSFVAPLGPVCLCSLPTLLHTAKSAALYRRSNSCQREFRFRCIDEMRWCLKCWERGSINGR